MKKTLVTILSGLFLLSSLVVTKPAFAGANCQPIYGGGQNCVPTGEISINKTVRHPDILKGGVEKFVDNLSINDSKYHADDQIVFRLTVTNNGDATFSSVEVKDILPQYVTFVSGPGNFDAGSKTLTYTLNELKAKESRTDTVVVKVTDATSLPISEGTLCTVNQSFATAEGSTDQDNSQFCIEKKFAVQPAPKIVQTPPTGPEMLPLIGLIPAGLGGLLLRRKSNIKSFKGGER